MSHDNHEPLISAEKKLPEITFKAVLLSIFIAVVLAASNTYLALKIGTTIAASIPAVVLAIGILRMFRKHNVLECNIVQTGASASEAIAGIGAFVLPAFLIMHYWVSFNYWETVLVMILGGILGVAFSIPLRKILLNMPMLPFPEGFAVGTTLRVSTEGGKLLRYLLQGAAASGLVTLMQSGFQVVTDTITFWRVGFGNILMGMSIGCIPTGLAAGYIVGVRVGISLLVGLVLGWGFGIPILSHVYGIPSADSAYDSAMLLWSHHLRYIGVGVMLVGGIWTLIRLLRPVFTSVKSSWAAALHRAQSVSVKIPRTERDIPLVWVLATTLVVAVIFYFCFLHSELSASISADTHFMMWIIVVSVLYLLIVGFMLSLVCGYFTGLVGSSNNPVSGLLILCILLLGLIYLIAFGVGHHSYDATKLVVAILFMTLIIGVTAAISNECFQDLKSGAMVGSTPWKQQIMLAIGVVVSALVVAPVLDLLFNAYGMGGVFPRAHMDPTQMLPAPQAMLLSSVAQGVITHHLDWSMIDSGVVVGLVAIAADEIGRRYGWRLPVLAMGLGIYLPPELMSPIIIGGFISHFAKKKIKKTQGGVAAGDHKTEGQQRALLLACGMVAGGSLMGVLLAIPFVIKGSSNALALVSASFQPFAVVLAIIITWLLCSWLYRMSTARAK